MWSLARLHHEMDSALLPAMFKKMVSTEPMLKKEGVETCLRTLERMGAVGLSSTASLALPCYRSISEQRRDLLLSSMWLQTHLQTPSHQRQTNNSI